MKFIGKFVARPAHSAAVRATALNHEIWNHTVENKSIVERPFFLLAGFFIGKLFRALGEADEIRDRFWRFVFQQAHHDVSL
jgi:hypothetical protein